jgi:tRNA nucleotidyltransferase/poly(A) polymerase
MGDYMFMLESHLSGPQMQALDQVQAAASDANAAIFLTGGAMRDMAGGFPIRDLDFAVEANPLKILKDLLQRSRARVVSTDEHRRSVELVFPGNVTVELGMARQETYSRSGAKPAVTPASIHEDLRRRDFTINSIALSLNRASRGLLIDPNNGQGDLERRELRANSNYTFYDDPSRILRLIRLRVRLGFTVEERTLQQYRNAREAGMEAKIEPQALLHELRQIAEEANAGEIMKALEEEKLLGLFSTPLSSGKLNLAGLQKLQKARQLVPFGVEFRPDNFGLFLYFLAENLSPKEKAELIKSAAIPKTVTTAWQQLDARARKLERELKAARLQKASMVYQVASKAPAELVLYLLLRSSQRLVQDRIRNYLQKYLPAAQEISDRDIEQMGLKAGTPKFEKAKETAIATRLDARPKKVPPVEEPPPPPPNPRGRPRGPSPPRSAAPPKTSSPVGPLPASPSVPGRQAGPASAPAPPRPPVPAAPSPGGKPRAGGGTAVGAPVRSRGPAPARG